MFHRIICVFSFSFLLSIKIFAQTDISYSSFLSKKKIAGVQMFWKTSENDYHIYYKFTDRSNGDSTITHIQTNPQGLITFLQTTGKDHFNNDYSEKFEANKDSAVWEKNGERKSAKNNNALYLSNIEIPAIFQLEINYLLTLPGYRSDAFPNGTLYLKKPILKKVTIKNQNITLFLVPMFFEPNPIPTYVWLTTDNNFFAVVHPWTTTIAKGYEHFSESLFAIQEQENEQYFAKELYTHSKSLNTKIVFKNAKIFDALTASTKDSMSIEVVNGIIKSIYPYSSSKKYLPTDSIIDCKDKFIMPGLWDMHSHYLKESGTMYVAGGVTHIRDMGNEKNLIKYKNQIERNKLIGPGIEYLSLLIDRIAPAQAPTGEIVDNLQEALKALDEYKKLGYQQLKFYNSVDTLWLKPLIKRAHSLQMKVTGHVPFDFTAEKCIEAGYNEITHMHILFLCSFLDKLKKEIKPASNQRFLGEYSKVVDFKSERVQQIIALMKHNNVTLDPTLNYIEGRYNEFTGDTSHYFKPIIDWLPKSWLPYLSRENRLGGDSQRAAYSASFLKMMKAVKLFYDNGIRIVAGTDGGDAVALHHELELYVQAGIPANEVLKIATYNAALNCGLENKYGQIKVGLLADFIVINGDPIKNISNIRRVELVIKNSRMYESKELLATQGWNYFY